MINIFYCTDDKLFGQQVISLLSLVKYTNEPLNVINLTVEVPEYTPKGKKTSEAQTKYCDDILKSKNKDSKFTTIDVSDLFRKYLFAGPNVHCKFYSYYVTVRLLADLIPEIPDKVIYLDSDVIFNNDIKELWDIDITDYEFAGRRDSGRITNYLQSGVMLLNMAKIRQSGSFRECCRLCSTKKYFCYIDMGALNTACKPKKRIGTRYNSYKYSPNCVAHHVCATREGNIPFTKKWWHRIKIDETDWLVRKIPEYKELIDDYLDRMKKNPELFTRAPKPENWKN